MLTSSRFLCLFFLFLSSFFLDVAHSAVIGIDLGTDSYKVGLINGQKFDIVLNAQTQRKTPSLVGFTKEGERVFGDPAKRLTTKFPERVFGGLQGFVGKPASSHVVQELINFVQYPIVEDPRGGIAVQYQNLTFQPEEILGMLFQQAKHIADAETKTSVRDCVLTVPPFYTEHERRGLIDAARLAGLNILGVLNEGTAAALNLAIMSEFPSEDRHVIFYDMGATSTKVSLMSMKTVNSSESKGKQVTHIRVEAVAWDRSLGGRNFDFRLAEHFAKIASKDLKVNVEENPRVLAKLRMEARNSKEVLSANQDVRPQIEGLLDEYDFKTTLTRKQFEELNTDLFERAVEPIKTVLKNSNLTIKDIDAVEMLGGGGRIPKIHETIQTYLQRSSLDHHLNGDEASVMGATFQAALWSSGFRTKNVIKVKEFTPYPVSLQIQPTNASDSKLSDTLFSNQSVSTKKNLNFRMSDNFSIQIEYMKNPLLPGLEGVREYTVRGVPTSEKYNLTEKPKIQVAISFNQSGLIDLEKAEAEINVLNYEKKYTRVNVTSTLNSTNTTESSTESPDQKSTSEDSSPSSSSSPSDTPEEEDNNVSESAQGESSSSENDSKTNKTDASDNSTTAAAATKPTFIEEWKPVKRIQRVKLDVGFVHHGFPPLSEDSEQFQRAQQRLAHYERRDALKKAREEAKNSLEAYIYEQRDKMETVEESSELWAVTTEEQRTLFVEALNAAGTWLEDEGADNSLETQVFIDRLQELKQNHGDKFNLRIRELEARPKAIEGFVATLNKTKDALANFTQVFEIKPADLSLVQFKVLMEENWFNDKQKEQEAVQPHEPPVLLSTELNLRASQLSSQLVGVLRKAKKKTPSPSPSASPSPSSSSEEEEAAASSSTSSSSQAAEEAVKKEEEEQNL